MIDTNRLNNIMSEIESLKDEALDIVRAVLDHGDTSTWERAYKGWNSEIETALSKHNQWLGQIAMDTLEETIASCEEVNDCIPDDDPDDDSDDDSDCDYNVIVSEPYKGLTVYK